MKAVFHPTRQKLLDAAVTLLGENSADLITVDLVLLRSGISKGSLYHHFEDFSDLLETASAELFVKSVDDNIAAIRSVTNRATNLATLLAGLGRVTEITQGADMRAVRFHRTRLLSLAEQRPRLMEIMSKEQARLTQTYTELFETCQTRGWFNADFSPHAAAVFIQAYTIGKIVDDVAPEPVDPLLWNDLIMKIVRDVFAKQPTSAEKSD